MKLEWDFNSGGSMGPNMLLRLGGHCVGKFYEDAHGAIDADDVREDIATRYNAHDALVAALEFYANAWNDGDWTFGTWKLKADQDGGDKARAALALARGEV